MQQLTTVYQKYVTQNPQSVNPPLSKLWEIALPTPLRIDAPIHSPSFSFVTIHRIVLDLKNSTIQFNNLPYIPYPLSLSRRRLCDSESIGLPSMVLVTILYYFIFMVLYGVYALLKSISIRLNLANSCMCHRPWPLALSVLFNVPFLQQGVSKHSLLYTVIFCCLV